MDEKVLYAWELFGKDGKVERVPCYRPDVLGDLLRTHVVEKSTAEDLEDCITKLEKLLPDLPLFTKEEGDFARNLHAFVVINDPERLVWTHSYHPQSSGSDETGRRAFYRTNSRESFVGDEWIINGASCIKQIITLITGVSLEKYEYLTEYKRVLEGYVPKEFLPKGFC
ncbi:MAG: hypothetical protein AABW79_01445 [Nanoarchaeota archaeon]